MATLVQDVRFALRLLVRSPAVSLVAALSLALGIGANTTVFTLVNAILLNPMPVRDISSLVIVGTSEMRNGTPTHLNGTSRMNVEDLRGQNTTFSGIAITGFTPLAISGGGEPEQVFAQIVSGNYFDVLGPRLAAGRAFAPEEDRQLGAHPVAVLSYGLWQRRFGGDLALIGEPITLNRQDFTVIGVTAEGFRGTFPIGGPDLWVPMSMYRELLSGIPLEMYNSRRGLGYQAIGRIKEGVTLEQARANADVIGKALAEQFPTDNGGRTFSLQPLAEGTFPPAFKQQLVLSGSLGMAIVALVLLIACGNVANLLLARASARRQEIAVRLSLGASRLRLMRQLLTESLLLALAGGIGGIIVAYWARALLWAYRPPFLQPGAINLDFDARVLTFTILISVMTGILFGLAPALQSSRPDLVMELKERTTLASGSHWYSVRHLLVVGQVALSLVALVSAGLFLRSLMNAQRIDPGFDGSRLLLMNMNVGTLGFDESRARDLHRRVLERVATVPGVEAATISTGVPFFGAGFPRTTFRDDQDVKDPRNGRLIQVNQVGDRYFETLGVAIVRGRAFNANDRQGAPAVAIINDTLAKQFYPNEEAIGRYVQLFGQPPRREIVGIAKTIKYGSLGEEPTPHVYLPLEQNYALQVSLQVRAAGDPEALLGTVRREVQAVEPTMPLMFVMTYPSVLRTALWAPRLGTSLLAIFGFLALLLAAVGLYGVMAYSVNQRTREIGIRMALGAEHRDVRNMVVRQGVLLALGGVVIGLAAAFGLARLVTKLLFGISGADPVTFAVIPIVLLTVALIASSLPAWRASRVDPVEALRV